MARARKSTTSSAETDATAEPSFPLDRLLDPVEGPRISGQPAHILAGVLHDSDPDAEYTRSEIAELVEAEMGREVGEQLPVPDQSVQAEPTGKIPAGDGEQPEQPKSDSDSDDTSTGGDA